MQVADCPTPDRASPWRWRLLAGLLILASAGLHVVYLAHECPLDLAPDEAHYWDWSRNLDWSYYSKGPLVAYLIRIGCATAGPLVQHLPGGQTLAVRWPAVACGSLLLVSLYLLTVQVYRRESLAAAVVGMALTLPVVSAGASLMTIDAPYTCCWGWALVLGYEAVFRRAAWAWPAAGLVIGLGILAKYTMVVWIPSLGLFLLATPGFRRLLLRPGFWVLTAVAGACCLPILVWNLQHDWVTFRHVGGQAGVSGTSQGIRWLGPLTFVGTQAALYLGFWFAAWAAAMVAHRPWRESDPGVRFLWWLSAPMFGMFLAFSLKTAEEPNWPVTAYLSGLVLAAAWLADQLQSPSRVYRWVVGTGLVTACGLGLTLTVLMHRTDLVYPQMARLVGAPKPERPYPLRRLDPTCRLRGWRILAAEVDRLRADLQAAGVEPVVAASSWTLPGELGFYCAGHPTVYSLGLAQGDRHSQYDLWRPNPVWDAEAFRGRTFLFVGDLGPVLQGAFEQIEAPVRVIHYEAGQPLAGWTVTICRGFRGLPPPAAWAGRRRF